MKVKEIWSTFKKEFDIVGIIKTSRYIDEAKKQKSYHKNLNYPTMVVLGLSYPKIIISSTKTHLVPSIYTFGRDYHSVIKEKFSKLVGFFDFPYELHVDNHEYNERLAASLAGIGFFGKNQLIINKDYGSFIFLALVMLDITIEQEIIGTVIDNCNDCIKCIEACPVNALNDYTYDMKKCISYFNQSKDLVDHHQITANYCLFGCDICQLVCPKNQNLVPVSHNSFSLTGKESISITDLFQMSEKAFIKKYSDMAYLWKGKTILMRNALMIMGRQKNDLYLSEIKESLRKHSTFWYQDTSHKVLKLIEKK
jgi:epoxyqueuosine reductase